MTAAEIQIYIFENSGLKTSVKRFNKGSMKGYTRIMPIFQNKEYPSIPENIWKELRSKLIEYDSPGTPLFCGYSEICVYGINSETIYMKREAKQKPVNENTTSKNWGSKNSQLRLDKATRRNAKRLQNGTTARYS